MCLPEELGEKMAWTRCFVSYYGLYCGEELPGYSKPLDIVPSELMLHPMRIVPPASKG